MVRELVGDTAYNKLVDFRTKHLKKIRICSRSKKWWDTELREQMRKVRRERRRVSRVGHRNHQQKNICARVFRSGSARLGAPGSLSFNYCVISHLEAPITKCAPGHPGMATCAWKLQL